MFALVEDAVLDNFGIGSVSSVGIDVGKIVLKNLAAYGELRSVEHVEGAVGKLSSRGNYSLDGARGSGASEVGKNYGAVFDASGIIGGKRYRCFRCRKRWGYPQLRKRKERPWSRRAGL